MRTEPLDVIPLWVLFFLVILMLGIALECGYRIGWWRHHRLADEKEQPVGAMVASTLGLVALVLGFTFSLAASRFDARRMAVLDEANAIGTTYLRARFLPQPQRGRVEASLREYAAVRLKGTRELHTEEALEQSEVIQTQLWQNGAEVANQHPNSITVGLFIQSLNELIDLHAKRVLVGIRSRIPLVIWIGVFGLAVLGMMSVGYQAGLSNTRRSPMMSGLVLAFAIVLSLITDLDRGQEGLLRVGQQAMVDVQHMMEPNAP